MRQLKRFIYFVVLNVIISAVTVIAVLHWWQIKHPQTPAEVTPIVIVVTPTQSNNLPRLVNNAGLSAITQIAAGSPVSVTLQSEPTPAMLTYKVKEGDILGALAVEFNVSVADIMKVNGITNPDSLYVGQIINIPTGPLPTATSTPVPATIVPSPNGYPSETPTQGPSATFTPTPNGHEPEVIIDSVIGVGVLDSEQVRLIRSGDGDLSLKGWRLEDGEGNVYTFPQLTLYKDGAVNLNTRIGQDTVVDLFWGLTSPIWRSGKTVYLYDAQNKLREKYTIP